MKSLDISKSSKREEPTIDFKDLERSVEAPADGGEYGWQVIAARVSKSL